MFTVRRTAREGALPDFDSKFINRKNIGELCEQSTKGRTLNGILNEAQEKKALETVCKCTILNYLDDRPDAYFWQANEHAILQYCNTHARLRSFYINVGNALQVFLWFNLFTCTKKTTTVFV